MLHGWTSISVAQQVVVGPGALRRVGEITKALGLRRLLLVTTPGRSRSDGMDQVRSALGRSLAATFDQVESGVSAQAVQAGVRLARSEGVDGLVSFGGGAATDTAKAIAFFLEHESGSPAAGFADRPLLPHIAIPTTLVGAPFSGWFSISDPNTRRASTAGAPTVIPSAIVVEPELGADLDADQLAASIAAVLGHGVETMWAPDRTPESDALAVAGLAHLVVAAPAALAEPGDIERRTGLLDAAVLCGRARGLVGDGLHHVLVELLASRRDVAYGDVHAALLPATARFTLDAVESAAEAIAQTVVLDGDAPIGGSVDNAAATAADRIGAVIDLLGPRRGLSDLGFDDEDLGSVARQAGAHRGVQTHPRPLGEADIVAIMEDAWV